MAKKRHTTFRILQGLVSITKPADGPLVMLKPHEKPTGLWHATRVEVKSTADAEAHLKSSGVEGVFAIVQVKRIVHARVQKTTTVTLTDEPGKEEEAKPTP